MSTVTGQIIINNALTALGILGQGETPSFSDSNDALGELNTAWEAWSIDEGIVYAEIPLTVPLSSAVASYLLGPTSPSGSAFQVARPTQILRANLTQVIGGGIVRKSLKIVGNAEYFAHGDLALSSTTVEELYPDWQASAGGNAGCMTIYVWPACSCPTATNLEMQVGIPFSSWTLTGSYVLPYAFQDALQYALAFRLLPRYGVSVVQAVADKVTALAEKAEARIREMNSRNRLVPATAVVSPQLQLAPTPQGQPGAPRG